MPEFIDPFKVMKRERPLNRRELSRAVRMALCAEEEAIHLYEALADATDDPCARAVFQDVADEERVHAGEFQRLLTILLPGEEVFYSQGAREVDEICQALEEISHMPGWRGALTVGQIKDKEE